MSKSPFPALMVQGTTSDAGKSTLVTALCRYYRRQGIVVAPFKPQNMALNSAVTIDGGEIGRAQAVQAVACGLPPHSDMNPVLLKPNSDTTAQVIIHGKVLQNQSAQQYHDYKQVAKQAVLESWQRLGQQYQMRLVEGAGSPAEINLRQGDIANMGFAEAVDCPVILIADIDRGGVFAHLVGTLDLLSASEQQRVVGFVINRFRGDIALLKSGLDWLEARTGKPVLAVLPYLHDLYLEAEDALSTRHAKQADDAVFHIVVPYLPSYGGYVRYGVGIVVTVLVGRYAIVALNRYLAAQQAAEAEPDQRRRDTLDYDQALGRLAKNVCPGCERPVDLKQPGLDFCPHCGIGLHDHCGQCHTRKNAWVRYCISCGAPARPPQAPT